MKRRLPASYPGMANMGKLKVSTREIGSVCVFDLEGDPSQETLQDVAWKIQRNIRRHRLQRIILNLQRLPSLDALGLRKLLAACIRPQKSLIFGASDLLRHSLEDTYVPRNVRVCRDEKEVAEDFGPFLLEREKEKEFLLEDTNEPGLGAEVERRRSKRMHVAIPVELQIMSGNGERYTAKAIATNISEGGMFAEYLDLEVAEKIDELTNISGCAVLVHIFPSANFPEEYRIEGVINRKELRKKQLGIAIEFDAGKSPEKAGRPI